MLSEYGTSRIDFKSKNISLLDNFVIEPDPKSPVSCMTEIPKIEFKTIQNNVKNVTTNNCEYCGKGLQRSKGINVHSIIRCERKHKARFSGRTFQCDKCMMSYGRPDHLKRHRRTVHDKVRFTCSHCQTSFCRKAQMEKHIKIKQLVTSKDARDSKTQSFEISDGTENGFQCLKCTKNFFTKYLLDIHLEAEHQY